MESYLCVNTSSLPILVLNNRYRINLFDVIIDASFSTKGKSHRSSSITYFINCYYEKKILCRNSKKMLMKIKLVINCIGLKSFLKKFISIKIAHILYKTMFSKIKLVITIYM